jgi:hypothetical protein
MIIKKLKMVPINIMKFKIVLKIIMKKQNLLKKHTIIIKNTLKKNIKKNLNIVWKEN